MVIMCHLVNLPAFLPSIFCSQILDELTGSSSTASMSRNERERLGVKNI